MGKKKRKIKQILSDTTNNNSLFAIRYKQEYREKLCIIMQLLIIVRYMGVRGKCKAKKSRDFSKHFKSSANRHRVERAGTDLIVATLPSLIYHVRLHA